MTVSVKKKLSGTNYWGSLRVNLNSQHSSEMATWRSWNEDKRQAAGQNSDSDMWTFQNCDVERLQIQMGDIKTPPPLPSSYRVSLFMYMYLFKIKQLKITWLN